MKSDSVRFDRGVASGAALTPAPTNNCVSGPPQTVTIEEYRRVVARCIELGEKIALGISAADILERVLRCRYPVHASISRSGYGWDTSRLNEVISDLAEDGLKP